MPVVELIAQTAELAAKSLSTAKAINYVSKIYPSGQAKVRIAVETTPGAENAVEVDSADVACRGLYLSSKGPGPTFESRIWGGVGSKLYRFNLSVTAAYPVGTIGSNGNEVSISDNGFEVVVVDGTAMYKCAIDHVDGLGVLQGVTLPNAPGTTEQIQPSDVVFIKQRFVVNTGVNNVFMYSDLADTTIQEDSFYSAESSADPITSIRECNGTLWVFGYRSYELWRPTDNNDDPFSPVAGSSSAVGTRSPWATASIDDKIFFLGSSDVGDDGVYIGGGTSIKRISTDSIEERINGFGDKDEAVGYAYSNSGDIYYVLTFRSESVTLVYNATNDLWHDRAYRNLTEGSYQYWPYCYIVNANSKLYSGLLNDGNLVRISNDIYEEWDGTLILREFIPPPLWSNLRKMRLKQVRMDMEVGATTHLSGQDADPEMILELSFDGGYTYGLRKRKSFGQQGEYRKSVDWRVKGVGREIVPKFTCSAKVAHTLYQMEVTYSELMRT